MSGGIEHVTTLIVALSVCALPGCAGRKGDTEPPETGQAEYDPLAAGAASSETWNRAQAAARRENVERPRKERPEIAVEVSQPFETDLLDYDGKVVRLKQPIVFAEDNTYIMEDSLLVIDDVIWMMESDAEITKMEIAVHAHPGMLEDERRITQARADLVRQYMVGKGIAADRIHATGYEATVPVASNSSAKGRKKNDRIEFVVQEIRGEPLLGGEAPPVDVSQ